jgi:hypothetical protein
VLSYRNYARRSAGASPTARRSKEPCLESSGRLLCSGQAERARATAITIFYRPKDWVIVFDELKEARLSRLDAAVEDGVLSQKLLNTTEKLT